MQVGQLGLERHRGPHTGGRFLVNGQRAETSQNFERRQLQRLASTNISDRLPQPRRNWSACKRSNWWRSFARSLVFCRVNSGKMLGGAKSSSPSFTWLLTSNFRSSGSSERPPTKTRHSGGSRLWEALRINGPFRKSFTLSSSKDQALKRFQ